MDIKIKFDKVKGKEKGVVKTEIEKTPKIAILTVFLLFTLLVAIIEAIVRHNWILVILIVVIAALISLPRVLEKWSHITLPPRLETYIIIFLYASLFLGELNNYYAKFWWWDVALHATSGVAFGIIGFIILYILYKAGKIKTTPRMIAMFTFAFALAIGALWEIVEFTIDRTFGPISNGVPMQSLDIYGCGLADTMKDLINDSLGALFSAIVGYFYLKKESGMVGTVVKPMVTEFKKDNPKLFKKKSTK